MDFLCIGIAGLLCAGAGVLVWLCCRAGVSSVLVCCCAGVLEGMKVVGSPPLVVYYPPVVTGCGLFSIVWRGCL